MTVGPFPQNPEPFKYLIQGELKYDLEKGELLEIVDDEIKRVVEVRAQMEDELLLRSVIYELRKRGYVVIPPPPK